MHFGQETANLIVLILIAFLGIVPVVLFSEYFFRPIKMKKMAKKFGLNYKLQKGWFIVTDGRRNIIQGKIGENRVEIFDQAVSRGYKPAFSHRFTQLKINSSLYVLRGWISGYYPVPGLENVLNEIKDTDGKYPAPPIDGPLAEIVKKQWRI